MKITYSEKEQQTELGKMYLDNLTKLFVQVWLHQNTLPLLRFIPFYYRLIDNLEVKFLRRDEYDRVNEGHMAITYLKDGHGVIIFSIDKLAEMYGRLLNLRDYFLVNTYAIVMSHELVHLYILRTDEIPRSEKWIAHRFLDEYQMGMHKLGDVYKEFKFKFNNNNNIKVQIYDNSKFLSYFRSKVEGGL